MHWVTEEEIASCLQKYVQWQDDYNPWRLCSAVAELQLWIAFIKHLFCYRLCIKWVMYATSLSTKQCHDIIIPIFQMKKLTLREVKALCSGLLLCVDLSPMLLLITKLTSRKRWPRFLFREVWNGTWQLVILCWILNYITLEREELMRSLSPCSMCLQWVKKLEQ